MFRPGMRAQGIRGNKLLTLDACNPTFILGRGLVSVLISLKLLKYASNLSMYIRPDSCLPHKRSNKYQLEACTLNTLVSACGTINEKRGKRWMSLFVLFKINTMKNPKIVYLY